MKSFYHREITREALGGQFEPEALETVIRANLGQDALRYQVGHDHFHYDANSFPTADAYCAELRRGVVAAVRGGDGPGARTLFGRLTHTVQDLYAHSNYVELWRESHPGAGPEEIEPGVERILKDAGLHSGKLYYPLEALSFLPALKPLIVPLLPHDSHAWMNKDEPSREGFAFAYRAAVRQTERELAGITHQLTAAELARLCGA